MPVHGSRLASGGRFPHPSTFSYSLPDCEREVDEGKWRQNSLICAASDLTRKERTTLQIGGDARASHEQDRSRNVTGRQEARDDGSPTRRAGCGCPFACVGRTDRLVLFCAGWSGPGPLRPRWPGLAAGERSGGCCSRVSTPGLICMTCLPARKLGHPEPGGSAWVSAVLVPSVSARLRAAWVWSARVRGLLPRRLAVW